MRLSSSLPSIFRFGLFVGVAGALMAVGSVDSTLFQRYMALNPRIDQASLAVAERRFADARLMLEPCLQKIPDHFEAHFLLARMAYEGRDYAGALAHVEIAEGSLADLDRRYRAERAALKAQDTAEEQATRDSLGEMIQRGGDPGGCSGHLLRLKQSAIDYLEAKKGHLYDQENPFGVSAPYRLLHGNCLYRLGHRDEALTQYRLAVQAEPPFASAWNNLLALLLETHDFPQARAELARAEAAHVTIRPDLKQAVLVAKVPVGTGAVSPR